MSKYLVIFLLFITFNSYAQFTISGKVTNKITGKPLASAVAFLNKTGIASTATDSGNFTLKNVPAGEYWLLVTIVGYEPYKGSIAVNGNKTLPEIELTPKNDTLSNVTVKANFKLSPYYYLFRNEFIGNTAFARQCKILNPWVIHFYNTDLQGNFSARSSDFIEVENDALGYRIKIMLTSFKKDAKSNQTSFNGQSYFEEMKGTPGDERTWQKNRLECYQGSVMQVLRSILTDSLKENGYRIKRALRKNNPYYNRNGLDVDPYDMDRVVDFNGESDNTVFNDKIANRLLGKKDLLLTTSDKSLFALGGLRDSTSNNSLYIEHFNDVVPIVAGSKPVHVPWIWNSTITFITFIKPYMIFDSNGKVLNPGSANYSGFFNEQTRIATQLPSDYHPMSM